MPRTTEILRLPYPEHPDPADVPLDVEALVNRLEELASGLFFSPGDLKVTAALEPPEGWLPCDGRQVLRDSFPDLFAAIGTQYGRGDGVSTFQIPDLRGRVPMGSGQAPGMTRRVAGDRPGGETHTHNVPHLQLLGATNMHRHGLTSARAASHRHGLSGVRVGIPALYVQPHRHTLQNGQAYAWIATWTSPGGRLHHIVNMRRTIPPDAVPPEGLGQPGGFHIEQQVTTGLWVNAFPGNQWPFPANVPGAGQGGSGVAYCGGRTDSNASTTAAATVGVSGTTDDAAGTAMTGTTDEGWANISGLALGAPTDAQTTLPPAQVVNVLIKT